MTSTRESSTGWLQSSSSQKVLTSQATSSLCRDSRKLLKRLRSNSHQQQLQTSTSHSSQLTLQALSTSTSHLHRLSSTNSLQTSFRLQWDQLIRLSATAVFQQATSTRFSSLVVLQESLQFRKLLRSVSARIRSRVSTLTNALLSVLLTRAVYSAATLRKVSSSST